MLAVLRPPRRRRHLLGFQYDGQPREDALALAVFGQLQLAGSHPLNNLGALGRDRVSSSGDVWDEYIYICV